MKRHNFRFTLLAITLLVIIATLWQNTKSVPKASAENNLREGFIWRTIDVSSAQENPDGCGYLIERDVEAHPELTFYAAFPVKLTRAGIITKYTIVYKCP